MRLVSHPLCPYVQRAAIVAAEKGILLEREFVDLSAKPDWFLAISPTGKVPLLVVDGAVLFESAPIAEYLDEVSGGGLLPADPVRRARHRAWVEFASATLSDIAGLYAARDEAGFAAKHRTLEGRFAQAEAAVAGPWFEGRTFGLADAAWAPVFRYLDAFERLIGLFLADSLQKVAPWRAALAARPSVAGAVGADYPARLEAFLLARDSWLSGLMVQRVVA
ncbi:glutathione S-transferase family protein [Roseomonas sp. CCTCC AB2023176]|uniref:glutathione S-transferase family protein n=1 Tax=Roseomonas sp. CCTCC AB2023176 TaxID=3342640 RepID=UPI0035D75657